MNSYKIQMKQKIVDFKKQIRREHINSIFAQKRKVIQKSHASEAQCLNILGDYHRNRRNNIFESPRQQIDIEEVLQQQCSEEVFKHRWFNWNADILKYIEMNTFEEYIRLIGIIYHDLKKIFHSTSSFSQSQQKQLLNFFLNLPIIVNIVNVFVQCCKNSNMNSIILQKISVKSLGILDLCVHNQPLSFTQNIFINSNILDFLACTLNQPKFDFRHMSKILNIFTHMIITSINQSGKLFQIMNNRESKLSVSMLFYNLSKMPMRPTDNLNQNFIIFMKHYLLQIDHRVDQKTKEIKLLQMQLEKINAARQFCCLTIHQIEMTLQLSIKTVNYLCDADCSNEDENCYFEESLEVLRIIFQLFDVGQRFKQTIKFSKLVGILSIKEFPHQIKEKILILLDHFIYSDQSQELTYYLVKQCDLLDRLRSLLKQSPEYVLNIFCNLVSISSIKQQLNQSVHSIYLSLTYGSINKYFFPFTYNWFHSQNFNIQSSFDKILIQTLSQYDEIDEYKNDYECMIWFRLAQNNEVQVPHRIIKMENQYGNKIRTQILNMKEVENQYI